MLSKLKAIKADDLCAKIEQQASFINNCAMSGRCFKLNKDHIHFMMADFMEIPTISAYLNGTLAFYIRFIKKDLGRSEDRVWRAYITNPKFAERIIG